jgi:hypothetical protein
MSVLMPEKVTFPPGPGNIPSVSPDGKMIAITALADGKTQIWVRDLDSLAATLAGGNGRHGPVALPRAHFLPRPGYSPTM